MAWKKLTFDWGQWAWHLGAIVLFFALSNGLFSLYHEGYSLMQPDLVHHKGMSQEMVSHKILTGEDVEWSNSMFSGMPTYQSGATSGGFNWAIKIKQWTLRPFASPEIGITFTGMLMAYLLAIALGIAPWWAMLGGVGFGLSTIGTLYLGAGHRTKIAALSYVPGMLAGLIWAYRGRLGLGLAVVVFTVGLHLASNHLQMTYYALILLAVVALGRGVHAWRNGTIQGYLRTTLWLVLAGLMGALPNSMSLLNTQSYAQYTTRGDSNLELDASGLLVGSDGAMLQTDAGSGDTDNSGEGLGVEYILEYSMSRMEWLSLMSPNFKGGAERVPTSINGQKIPVPVYWGEQKFSGGAFYFGAAIMALFFMFLLVGKHWLRWPFLVVSVLAIVLSWRDVNFINSFFLDYMPLFNKFRDTKMMLVLVQVMAGAGALLMVHEVAACGASKPGSDSKDWGQWTKQRNRYLFALGGIFAVFSLFYVAPTLLLDFEPSLRPDPLAGNLPSAKIEAMRVEVFRADVLRTLLLTLLSGLTILMLLYAHRYAKFVALALVAIQSVDLWQVNLRYHSNEIVPGQPTSWVSNAEAMFPFEPSKGQLSILSFEKQGVAGFEETEAKIYEALKDRFPRRMRPEDQTKLSQIAQFEALRAHGDPFRVLQFNNPYNDAETSYFFQSIGGYHGAKLKRYQDFIGTQLRGELTLLADSAAVGRLEQGLAAMWGHRMLNTRYILAGTESVIPFSDPSGPAWFVDEVQWVNTSNDEAIQTAKLRDLKRAVVAREFEDSAPYIGSPGVSSVALKEHSPEYIAYEVQSENGGVLVFSEVYYPVGWSVFIDGEEVDLMRANFILRAASVPPGNHLIEMSFGAEEGGTPAWASIGSVAGLIFMLLAVVWSFRDDQTEQPR